MQGRKTYFAAAALIFLSLGSVLQGTVDGTAIDWTKIIAQLTAAAGIIGACHNGPSPAITPKP